MKKLTTRVLRARNGSRYAVVGSGNSDMSDSWIAWKPRIDEPSKFSPSSKTDWLNEDSGTVKCCITPGRSQKRTSTISTFSSLTYFRRSSLFANIGPPCRLQAAGCVLAGQAAKPAELGSIGGALRRTPSREPMAGRFLHGIPLVSVV